MKGILGKIMCERTAMYIRTMNIDEPLMRIEADGTIRHYKTDALGSVIGLVDDTGAIKTGYTYDPFGSVTVLGEVSDNPFQYTGRENDGTGLYYYRARYYSPDLQRFISEDPIDFAGGINFYAYVGNNPVNFMDSMGLCESSCIPFWRSTSKKTIGTESKTFFDRAQRQFCWYRIMERDLIEKTITIHYICFTYTGGGCEGCKLSGVTYKTETKDGGRYWTGWRTIDWISERAIIYDATGALCPMKDGPIPRFFQ